MAADTTDRAFKHIMQDVNRVYVGARMTYGEMISWDEVPFKICAIVSKELLPSADEDTTLAGHIATMSRDDFSYRVLKQLKIRIKAGTYTYKEKKDGTRKEKYKSEIYSLEDFKTLTESGEEYMVEEIIFNKLALLGFST